MGAGLPGTVVVEAADANLPLPPHADVEGAAAADLDAVLEPFVLKAETVELVGQVLAAPVRSMDGRIERRYCFVVFNLIDRTAVRRLFLPGTGELRPGVVVPPPFAQAIEGALEAEGRTCGRAA